MYKQTKRGRHIQGLAYQKQHVQDPAYLRHGQLKAKRTTAMLRFLKSSTKVFESTFKPRSGIVKKLEFASKANHALKQAENFYF